MTEPTNPSSVRQARRLTSDKEEVDYKRYRLPHLLGEGRWNSSVDSHILQMCVMSYQYRVSQVPTSRGLVTVSCRRLGLTGHTVYHGDGPCCFCYFCVLVNPTDSFL